MSSDTRDRLKQAEHIVSLARQAMDSAQWGREFTTIERGQQYSVTVHANKEMQRLIDALREYDART